MPTVCVDIASSRTSSIHPSPTAGELDSLLSLITRDSDLLMENLLGKLKDVLDVDALEARAVEGAGLETECQRVLAKEIFRRRRAQLENERVKKMKTKVRKETKRGAVGMDDGNEILKDLVDGQERADSEWEARSLGVDYKNFMDWGVSILQALQLTFVSMSKMVGMVALFGACAWINVVVTAGIVGAEEEEGNKTVGMFTLGSALGGGVMIFAAVQWSINMKQLKSYVLHLLPPVGVMACTLAYYEFGGSHISGIVLGVIFVATAALNGSVLGYCFIGEKENWNLDNYMSSKAATRAANALGGEGREVEKSSMVWKLKQGIVLIIPIFFALGILVFLVVAILNMFKMNERVSWKIFVTALALGIKICGNKILLGIMGHLPMFLTDHTLFCYEYSTALIVRILQLSLPDENTAMLIGLAGAVIEVGTRIFFYMLFLKKGLQNPLMTDEEKKRYAKRGKLRVQDASNDMVVEYMSSIVAGLFIIHLAPTGIFSFATTAEISNSTVIKLCAFQIVPELFLDSYVTFMEIYGGLKDLHVSYWKTDTGGIKNSNHLVGRLGDLPKATVIKMADTWAFTAFVIAVCVK
ncbi:hypothetical protein TrCOL_g2680 [Triparma columacea]|uniref:Uncharacterized protein n=1 Tax=Triparma columacea TaxID=722753 RepID=A0A9W7GIC6_9STRA|nr:hypothetical protein TrCOL_g2680 [Triparma columacea]